MLPDEIFNAALYQPLIFEIIRLRGQVQIGPAPGFIPSDAGIGDILMQGDRVFLGEDSAIKITIPGTEISFIITGPGDFTFDELLDLAGNISYDGVEIHHMAGGGVNIYLHLQ